MVLIGEKKGTVDGWGMEARSGQVREGYDQNTLHKGHFRKRQRMESDQLEDTVRKVENGCGMSEDKAKK